MFEQINPPTGIVGLKPGEQCPNVGAFAEMPRQRLLGQRVRGREQQRLDQAYGVEIFVTHAGPSSVAAGRSVLAERI